MAEVEGFCHVSNEALVQLAIEARNHAYVPYSHYAVGAALLCSDGTVYGGANLENAAYTPSNCAERTAFFRAVFEGRRDFVAIAVVGGPEGEAPTALVHSLWCMQAGYSRVVRSCNIPHCAGQGRRSSSRVSAPGYLAYGIWSRGPG